MARRVRGAVAQSGMRNQEIDGTVPDGTKAILVTLQEAATYTIHGITFTKGIPKKLPAEQLPLFKGNPWFTIQNA